MQPASTTSEDSPIAVPVEALGPDVRTWELQPGRPPLFIEPAGEALLDRAAFLAWAESVRPVLDALIARHGGIVLRGFPTPETADFAALVELFPAFAAGYTAGGTPRATIQGRVMEATRFAAPMRLPLHSEMAYMRDYPKRIAFFCRQAATIGGETTIGDMRELIAELPASMLDKLERHGVRTTRNYAPKRDGAEQPMQSLEQVSWDAAFGTDDPAEVEALCAERGLEPLWTETGGLTLFNRTEPFVMHPLTGRRLYRTALHIYNPKLMVEGADKAAVDQSRRGHAHPSGTFFGDGTALTDEEFQALMACVERATFSWPWRDGDVMILDNLQVWHGRNPYQGPRDVQVALLD